MLLMWMCFWFGFILLSVYKWELWTIFYFETENLSYHQLPILSKQPSPLAAIARTAVMTAIFLSSPQPQPHAPQPPPQAPPSIPPKSPRPRIPFPHAIVYFPPLFIIFFYTCFFIFIFIPWRIHTMENSHLFFDAQDSRFH
jgi:hypothetical protein